MKVRRNDQKSADDELDVIKLETRDGNKVEIYEGIQDELVVLTIRCQSGGIVILPEAANSITLRLERLFK